MPLRVNSLNVVHVHLLYFFYYGQERHVQKTVRKKWNLAPATQRVSLLGPAALTTKNTVLVPLHTQGPYWVGQTLLSLIQNSTRARTLFVGRAFLYHFLFFFLSLAEYG